jgi:sugar transferase (PEP-CTERM/EpsH1 system associated)
MSNILFLCHRLPFPPDKGDKIRAWHMLEHLARRHRVYLATFVDDDADWQYLPVLQELCAEVGAFAFSKSRQKLKTLLHARTGRALTLDYFHDKRLQRWVDDTIAHARIDRVFVFSSSMAPYALRHPALPGVLDMVDVDSGKFTAYAAHARFPFSLVWRREGRTLEAFERVAARGFDHTLFVTEQERARFAAIAPDVAPRTRVVTNGVDLLRFSPEHAFANPFVPDTRNIVFTGTMDYWPNADAAAWFAREVLPRLRERPDAPEFHIVGAHPGRETLLLGRLPGVHVTGRVPDTRPYLAHASLVVAPLRVALGVQNKVLEAMAMARPLIASPQAFDGVEALPGLEILLADTVTDWLDATGAILAGEYPDLGDRARAAIERASNWDENLRPLDALLGLEPPAPLPVRTLGPVAP